ncbi:MAG: DNA oxidative demethylase AlkB [Acetobacteraceae bacterium]|nr:DNA oxidative demethylase AlkB [Acetobacteraceae bacterium]
MGDLLSSIEPAPAVERLSEAAVVLHGFASAIAAGLVAEVDAITAVAPFRNMVTPGGFRMSVAMTNCGRAGWVTDRKGYRYEPVDPITGIAWPPIPECFRDLAASAAEAAGYLGFEPDACLMNLYEPGTRLSLHRDENERDLTAPIVSVSLGLPAIFLFGGNRRSDRPRRILLESGDVVVWGGPDRLVYHGVAPLPDGDDPLTGNCRINLTFRKAL